MTIEEITGLYKTKEQAEADALEALRDLLQEDANAKYEYAHAINAGSEADVLKASIRWEKVKNKVELQKEYISRGAPISYPVEEIREGWNKYISKNNRAFDEKYSQYQAARKALAEMFTELVDMQREVIKNYNVVYRILSGEEEIDTFGFSLPPAPPGIEKPHLLKRPESSNAVKLNNLPAYPDSAFFEVSGDISKAKSTSATRTALYQAQA